MVEKIVRIVAGLDPTQPRQVRPVVGRQWVGELGVGEVLIRAASPVPGEHIAHWLSHWAATARVAAGSPGSEVDVRSRRNSSSRCTKAVASADIWLYAPPIGVNASSRACPGIRLVVTALTTADATLACETSVGPAQRAIACGRGLGYRFIAGIRSDSN